MGDKRSGNSQGDEFSTASMAGSSGDEEGEEETWEEAVEKIKLKLRVRKEDDVDDEEQQGTATGALEHAETDHVSFNDDNMEMDEGFGGIQSPGISSSPGQLRGECVRGC